MALFKHDPLPTMTTPPPPTPTSTPPEPTTTTTTPETPTARTRKQLTLLLAGTTFYALSTLITRRAITRRQRATIPKFYQPSNRPASDVNGGLEALEALSVATVNVTSFAMMVAGGLLWVFDICSLEELRWKVRGGYRVDGSGGSEGEAGEEVEVEEWVAGGLARREEMVGRRGDGEGEGEGGGRNERGRPR